MILQFTENELAVLDKALQQLPYHMAAPLINNILNQILAQQAKSTKDTD